MVYQQLRVFFSPSCVYFHLKHAEESRQKSIQKQKQKATNNATSDSAGVQAQAVTMLSRFQYFPFQFRSECAQLLNTLNFVGKGLKFCCPNITKLHSGMLPIPGYNKNNNNNNNISSILIQ